MPLHRGKESTAGDSLLDSMEAMGFMAPASFVKEGRPTCCGLQGSTRSIDHFLTPKETRRIVRNLEVCWRLGRVVQMAPCQQAVDHMPLLMELHHAFAPRRGQAARRIAWRQCTHGKEELSFLRISKARCRRPKQKSRAIQKRERESA